MISRLVFGTNNQIKYIAVKMDKDADLPKPQQIVWRIIKIMQWCHGFGCPTALRSPHRARSPEGGCDPQGRPCWSRLLAERSPRSRAGGRACPWGTDPVQGTRLEQPLPAGLQNRGSSFTSHNQLLTLNSSLQAPQVAGHQWDKQFVCHCSSRHQWELLLPGSAVHGPKLEQLKRWINVPGVTTGVCLSKPSLVKQNECSALSLMCTDAVLWGWGPLTIVIKENKWATAKFLYVLNALLVLTLKGAFRLCSDKEGNEDVDAVKEMESCS